MRTSTRILFCIVLSIMLIVPFPMMQVKSACADTVPKRFTVFISDLHWGLGKDQNGKWDPMEDSRWPNAFKGFLDKIVELGNNAVDLVIVGDLFDFWQPPASVRCEGHGANLGCTVDEMKVITSAVVTAHKEDFTALRNFLNKDNGSNHLYVIPGNHDAVLLLPDIWNSVMKELGAPSGEVTLVANGSWISADGRIVAEHGHQIGSDVNRYEKWPEITARVEGKEYILRPWGEQFVQKLFNDEERCYPIIDNLSPETAGTRYRMADQGLWKSASDVARFIAFNIFERHFSRN